MTDLSAAVEQSTYIVHLAFADEEGTAMVPTAASWSLRNDLGAVVNSRLDVTITPLASSVDLVLSGDDLACFTGTENYRILTVSSTYSGDYGTGLPLVDEYRIPIEQIRGVLDEGPGTGGTVGQAPGVLNLTPVYQGTDFTWSSIWDGDLSADTFTAFVGLASPTISVSYAAGTDETTIAFTLSDTQTAALPVGFSSWYCLQTTGGTTTPILIGTAEVVAL